MPGGLAVRAVHDLLRGSRLPRPGERSRRRRRSRQSACSPPSPLEPSFLACVFSFRAAFRAVSSRSASWSTLTPLPSADATPRAACSCPSGPFRTGACGTGRSSANASASAAQSSIISCSCRFPMRTPVAASMISRALSYVPDQRMHLRQLPDLPGEPARRQVQHRVPRMQRIDAPLPGPVGDPPDRHVPQHRQQRRPAVLQPRAPHPIPEPPSPPAAVPPHTPGYPAPAAATRTQYTGSPPRPAPPCHPAPPDCPRPGSYRTARTATGPDPGSAASRGRRHPRQIRRQHLPARRQPVRRIPFHPRLPFPWSLYRNSGPYGTEASPAPRHSANPAEQAEHRQPQTNQPPENTHRNQSTTAKGQKASRAGREQGRPGDTCAAGDARDTRYCPAALT